MGRVRQKRKSSRAKVVSVKNRGRPRRASLTPPSSSLDSPVEVKTEVDHDYVEFVDIGKTEEDISNCSEEETSLSCILCGKSARKGLQLDPNDMSEESMIMFMFRKILGIPEDKIRAFLDSIDPPSNWISSCKECRGIIVEAYSTQKKIEKLEVDLRKCQDKIKIAIRGSWNVNEVKSEFSPQPISTSVRCLVTKKYWPRITLPPQKSLPFRIIVTTVTKQCPSGPSQSSSSRLPLPIPMEPSFPSSFEPSEGTTSEGTCEPLESDLTATKSTREYPCKLCPYLRPLPLQSFVQHILYHKRKSTKLLYVP